MPGVRRADLGNVPADRAGDWVAVCGGVPGVWGHANDGEMAVFYVLDPDSDGNRFARAAAAGHGELAGICGGAYVFGVFAAGPWARGGSRVAVPTKAVGRVFGGEFFRDSFGGVLEVF